VFRLKKDGTHFAHLISKFEDVSNKNRIHVIMIVKPIGVEEDYVVGHRTHDTCTNKSNWNYFIN
jgi:hypothetical protein